MIADTKEKNDDTTDYQNYKQEEAVNGNMTAKDAVKEIVNVQSNANLNNPHIGIPFCFYHLL